MRFDRDWGWSRTCPPLLSSTARARPTGWPRSSPSGAWSWSSSPSSAARCYRSGDGRRSHRRHLLVHQLDQLR